MNGSHYWMVMTAQPCHLTELMLNQTLTMEEEHLIVKPHWGHRQVKTSQPMVMYQCPTDTPHVFDHPLVSIENPTTESLRQTPSTEGAM